MNQQLFKVLITLKVLVVFYLSGTVVFAQTQPQKLVLGKPINSEIKGGETQIFSVSLLANETARVEVVQNGVDVNFTAINPRGEEFIISLSPSGYFGDDLILVTGKETGEYKVAVSPASPRAKSGKYTIVLRELRPTVDEDFQINEASAKILQLAQKATQLKYNGTIEGLRDAVAKWDEVIAVSKIKKDRVWEGVAIVAQGLIYKQLGEFQNALDAHLKSLEIWRELENRQYEGSAVNNIGSAYGDLGEYEKSLPYFERSANINREVGDRISLGFSLNNLADVYRRIGNFEKAEDFGRQSLAIKREDTSIRGKRSLANTLKNLGFSLIAKGEVEEGLGFIQESMDLRREIDYRWGIADSLLALGKLKKENRFENLKEANRLSIEVGDRRLHAESFYLLAKAEHDRGNLEKAIENISKGLEIIEEIRSEIVGSQSRYAYFSTVQGYYELYTDLLVRQFEKTKNQENIKLALEISERSRSRSLVELLQEAKVDFKRGIDPKLLSQQKNLQKQINDKYATRQRLLSGKSKPEQITKIKNELNELNTRLQNLNLRIRRENPKFADLSQGKTISAQEIQSLLDDQTVLLEYKLGEKRSFVWAVTQESIEVFILPSREKIEGMANSFYNLIVRNKRAEQARTFELSKDLYRVLLLPVAAKIADKRIAIVADGVLQYIPFSALHNNKRAVADENQIVILPSASVLAQIRENPNNKKQNNKTIAIFADPVFDREDSRISQNAKTQPQKQNAKLKQVLRDFTQGEKLPRLLFSRQEARIISYLVPENKGDVKIGFEANLENVESSNLSDYQIIHFATHGLLNTSRPELSGLVFSLYNKNGQPQDGFLSLNNIYNLNLSSDLVALSACQTALGKNVRGEGLIGLSRGFLYAGSKRIVASLWKVDDTATARFMELFYRNYLEEGLPASSALQQAKIEMKEIPRYKSPFYWSAFTLLGEWK